MKMEKIVWVVILLVTVLCGASTSSASSINQYTLHQISYGSSFDVTSYGQLDWAIVGINEKTGGNMISTTGSGNTTTLVSTVPGGTSIDFFTANYPYFTYVDGALPTSSAPFPGDHSGYQYDKPAVDILLPAGLTQMTIWMSAGYVGDASYQATLADGTTTGNISYWEDDATFYLLQLNIQSDASQTFRFSIQHPDIGDPYSNNAGLFGVAVNPVPLPASVVLLFSGLGSMFAVRRSKMMKTNK
ncbi:MAG: VPLPA-CTERM sorting domain-containing protein [Proteobacteria bacterium]|nr:VPLPA-CTERM sorting domain-containing protein [Pseudomonadota bacterium]